MRSMGIALCSLLLFSATAAGQNVTFHKNVLPILQAKCQSCHRPGEIPPMSFLTYQSTEITLNHNWKPPSNFKPFLFI